MKTQLGNVSNDAESTVLTEAPYAVEVEFTGSALSVRQGRVR